MTKSKHFNEAAHEHLLAHGYTYERMAATWEEDGDAESGPHVSGGPEFDQYTGADEYVFIAPSGLADHEKRDAAHEAWIDEHVASPSPGLEAPERSALQLIIRDDSGNTTGTTTLAAWAAQAADCYEPEELSTAISDMTSGKTFRVDMNLGRFIDLIPVVGTKLTQLPRREREKLTLLLCAVVNRYTDGGPYAEPSNFVFCRPDHVRDCVKRALDEKALSANAEKSAAIWLEHDAHRLRDVMVGGESDFPGVCSLGECFADQVHDNSEYEDALAQLLATGNAMVGGGAAPLVTLRWATDDEIADQGGVAHVIDGHVS